MFGRDGDGGKCAATTTVSEQHFITLAAQFSGEQTLLSCGLANKQCKISAAKKCREKFLIKNHCAANDERAYAKNSNSVGVEYLSEIIIILH